MQADIITIGDELLIGQVIDTNSSWMASELNKAGLSIRRIISVPDDEEELLDVLQSSMKKSGIVITTGGLSPTKDDITKKVLCELFDTSLYSNEDVLKNIKKIVASRKITLNENNRKQAEVPGNCDVIMNERGTAPGLWFEKSQKVLISIPGVPHEMKYLITEKLIPSLKEKYKLPVIIHKTIITQGTYEARLAELLEGFEQQLPGGMKLAYLPTLGVIRLRLSATGKNRNLLGKQVDEQVEKLKRYIADYFVGLDNNTPEVILADNLTKSDKTIAVAESCTGGFIAHLITSVPGSSKYFQGGVIAYSNEVKTAELGVKPESIKKYGAVSRQVVEEMSKGILDKCQVDYSIATSGIAGPSGGTEDKPVGTVWIAVRSKDKVVSEKYIFGNHRERNIKKSAYAAIAMLIRRLLV